MKKAFELTIKKGIIPVFAQQNITENILSKVQACKKFKDYVSKIENTPKEVQVDKIEILGVEMLNQKVEFVNLRAITKNEGHSLPSYVFLIGRAVAILVLVNDKILVVQQYRPPIQQTLLQAPAGMMDQMGDFVGAAAQQLQEQTGLKINNKDLHQLGQFYPSQGGCDQCIKMFYCKIKLSQEQIKDLCQKSNGVEKQGQKTRVKLINFDAKQILETKDVKLINLVYAYQGLVLKDSSKL